MRISDIILKKRDGKSLTKEEINFFIEGYTNDRIPDYQISALLMAIYFNGMSEDETLNLTMAIVDSGEKVDLSKIEGIKVDKHSTGGVGDKISICLAPMVAAAGGKVAKMSGRGLGHTGGTIDKLEAIKGMRLDLSKDEFINNVNNIGLSIASQTGKITPADKKLYALRDVTSTVDSMPLIASSVMSKKIASGADGVVLDVKVGSGAFMKTLEDGRKLAKEMVSIGNGANVKTIALITNMDEPLGYNVGNSLEIIEAVDILNGKGPKDVLELTVEIGANMLLMSKKFDSIDKAKKKLLEVIKDKSALNKLKEMVLCQGGDSNFIDDTRLFKESKFTLEVKSYRSGYIKKIDSEEIGRCSLLLGAGRENKNSEIDLTAGIKLFKKVGDFVEENEALGVLYYNKKENINEAEKRLLSAYTLTNKKINSSKIILDIIK